jgi:type IV secretion system protein VirB4
VITSIWLPNDRADAVGYAKFGIKGKVFETVAAMGKLSREMVVVQGHQAVKLKLALTDQLKYWLPLMSTTQKNAAVAKRVREHQLTNDPAIWVPAFLVAEHVRQWLNTDDPEKWTPAYKLALGITRSMNSQDPRKWMPAFKDAWQAQGSAHHDQAIQHVGHG